MKCISETIKPAKEVIYLTENKVHVKKDKATFTHYIKIF